MSRTHGAIQHPQSHFDYIRNNWKTHTDAELATAMKLKPANLQKLRLSIGCRRSNLKIKDPATIALILELFANHRTIASIAKIVDKTVYNVDNVINAHYMRKKSSFNTITLTLQSKINYEPNPVTHEESG